MVVNDVGKAALLVITTAGVFALLLTGRAELTEVDWILAAVIAYTTGNGVLAARRQAPSPMLVPKYRVGDLEHQDDLEQRVDDLERHGDLEQRVDDLERHGDLEQRVDDLERQGDDPGRRGDAGGLRHWPEDG